MTMTMENIPNPAQDIPVFKDWYDRVNHYDKEFIKLYQDKALHISHSSMTKFRESPYNFLINKTTPRDSTASMGVGKMVHMLLFEPKVFSENYFVLDDTEIVERLLKEGYQDAKGKMVTVTKPKSTAVYRAWKAEYMKHNEGKEMIEMKDLISAKAALKRMFANRGFADFIRGLKNPKPEHTLMGEVQGYPVKMILDNDSDNVIFDLKYVANNSLRGTTNDYWGEKYWTFVQQGLYASYYNFKKKTVIGYLNHMGDIRLREVPVESLRYGAALFNEWVGRFDYCVNELKTFKRDSDFWDPQGTNILHVPHWLENEDA